MADIVTLTAEDNDASVTLDVGGSVVFELEENPTTGYRWQIGSTTGVLALEDDDFSPGEGVGAGGWRRLRFVATEPGNVVVLLALARQWAPDQRLKSMTVNVTVSR